MGYSLDWEKLDREILSSFPEEYSVVDYWGRVVDRTHVKRYLAQGRKRVELLFGVIAESAPPGSKVLEVGTAYGMILFALREAGYDVCGSDLPESIEYYSTPLVDAGIQVIPWDMHREWPSDIEMFDVVIASEVLEHLQVSLNTAVEKLSRLLRPGGWLVITTPNIYSLPDIIKILNGENINEPFPDEPAIKNNIVVDSRTHPREPAMKELLHSLKHNGLVVKKKTYFTSGKRHPMKELIFALSPRRFNSNLLGVFKE